MDTRVIDEYIKKFCSSQFNYKETGRYQSWNIVFNDFSKHQDDKDYDYLARSLTLYLASWGMMRGSSKLLTDYNYRIHIPAVEIILADFSELKNYPQNEKEIDAYVKFVWKRIIALKDYYSKVSVSPTDTLLTKIMLGTEAATPAYDQYFKKFLKANGLTQKLGEQSLKEVWALWFKIKSDLSNEAGYPPMKLLDMAGFQYGQESE
jgi:hypothetical protein